jgi:NDP-sugar pyrophosphorylase family protein
MQAIILSGGLGTRLHPLTLNTPKPMLPINGVPHLEYQIRLLREHGITDIIFSTGYLHKQIEDYFGDGSKFGVRIQYKEDGEVQLGTAGAVKNCEDLITSESFIILNGDILTNISLESLMRVHTNFKQPITLTMLQVIDATGFGLLDYDKRNGRIKAFIEKPDKPCSGAINAGIYMMNTDVLHSIPEGFSMLENTVFPRFAQANMLQGFMCVDDYAVWIDIGTHERYAQAQEIAKKYF